jgi:NitT/TauT family transport system ATP-binding protein
MESSHKKVIVVDQVRKLFRIPGQDEVTVVDGLSFEVDRGEVITIVGRTGCGKSTCFNMLLGLEPPTRGTILIEGRDPFREFQFLRSKIGAIFQTDRLLPWRTALENAMIGLEIIEKSKKNQREIALTWLHKLGLDGFEKAYPYQLSGGMRQRVGMARAFAVNPNILLADEAFGHLDQVTSVQLRKIFLELIKETQKTCLVVTHNIGEAIEIGRRMIVLGKPSCVLLDERIPEFCSEKDKTDYEERIVSVIDANRMFNG